jgi:hypothetical protein
MSIVVDPTKEFLDTSGRGAYRLLKFYAVWLVAFHALFMIAMLSVGDPYGIAIMGMGTGLLVIWVVIGGLIQRRVREPLRLRMRDNPGRPVLKFFLFATLMVCLEEAVTTAMTNTAPLYGFSPYEAFITASPNYLEVIALHSVVVFLPHYLVWGLLLKRYQFHPAWVVILYGLTGLLCEGIAFGWEQNLPMFAFWTFVYGLIVYLPAYAINFGDDRKRPGVGAYVLALVGPFLMSIPWTLLVIAIRVALGLGV